MAGTSTGAFRGDIGAHNESDDNTRHVTPTEHTPLVGRTHVQYIEHGGHHLGEHGGSHRGAVADDDGADGLSVSSWNAAGHPHIAPGHAPPRLMRRDSNMNVRALTDGSHDLTLHVGHKLVHVVEENAMVDGGQEADEAYCTFGSTEHMSFLKQRMKELLSQREAAERLQLEAKEAVDSALTELDALSSQLSSIKAKAGDKDSGSSTSATHHTVHQFGNIENIEAIHDEDEAKRERDWALRMLYRPPRARQYSIGKTLYREMEERKTSWIELFYDLVFVGVVAKLGDNFQEDPTQASLHHFVLLFMPIFRMWGEFHLYLNRFDTHDLFHRVMIFCFISSVVFMGSSAADAFVEGGSGSSYSGGMCVCRAIIMCMYIPVAVRLEHFRGQTLVFLCHQTVSVSPWFISIFVADTYQIPLWWSAIAMDMSFALLAPLFLSKFYASGGRRLALSIEHHAERYGLFVLIVLGESVNAALYANEGTVDKRLLTAVFGLLTAYNFESLYYDVDGSRQYQHALRRSILTAVAWNWFHIPLLMALILAGSSLHGLVNATDGPGHVPADDSAIVMQRRLFCGGYAIAVFCLAVMGMCHKNMESAGTVCRSHISKKYRITARIVVSVVLAAVCSTSAHQIQPLALVSIVTAASTALVAFEIFGKRPVSTNCDVLKSGDDASIDDSGRSHSETERLNPTDGDSSSYGAVNKSH
eukprot:Opistho-2@75804